MESLLFRLPLPEMTIDRDLKSLDANYLIDNIDRSYDAWKKAPWHGQVSFDTYCQYILPYRINTERLSAIGWRDTLSGRYYPLIRGEKNVKKRLQSLISTLFIISGIHSPIIPDRWML